MGSDDADKEARDRDDASLMGDIGGEERIAAPRDVVWAALNDPDMLRPCIPGCQKLEWTSPTELAASIRVKIGPIPAHFSGTITLSDVIAPASYTISGQGKGGLAGFAKGSAKVTLKADGDETLLRYETEAQLGGRLAKLGAKLISAAAQKLGARFFADFSEAVTKRAMEAGKA